MTLNRFGGGYHNTPPHSQPSAPLFQMENKKELIVREKEANYLYTKPILDDLKINDWILENVRKYYPKDKTKITDESILRYIKENPRTDKIPKKPKIKDKEIKDNEINEEEIRKDLRKVYKRIRSFLSKYMDIDNDNKEIIALWIIGTYFHNEFETFPYLFINAMRGSGKTRALKIVTKMSKDGSILISLTEASLFRTTGTLGIDEFENLGSKDKQALRELLNAGYKKGISVIRMAKKKTLEGEKQVPEKFECYRPIAMANIWGMEEVLGDRCITVILEKSSNALFIRLIEDFENSPEIEVISKELDKIWCSLCSKWNKCRWGGYRILHYWNDFIKFLYTPELHITTHTPFTPQTTYNTLTTLNNNNNNNNNKINNKLNELEKEDIIKLHKIHDTHIDGRNLELYFPLFQIADLLGDDVFDKILKIASKSVENKRVDEIADSTDVSVYQLIATLNERQYYKIKELVSLYRLFRGESSYEGWANERWFGRALKRLNLIVNKRRMSDGVEVTLNIKKSKEKSEIFK